MMACTHVYTNNSRLEHQGLGQPCFGGDASVLALSGASAEATGSVSTPPGPPARLVAVGTEYEDADGFVIRPPDERPAVRPVEIPAAEASMTPGRAELRCGARLMRRPFEVRIRVRDHDFQVLRQLLQPLDQFRYRHAALPKDQL